MTQHWKSALMGAAVIILSGTAAAGTASAHELPGMAKTAAAASADRPGNCTAHLSIKHDSRLGYEIKYGGSSSGWAPSSHLRITAVLMVDGKRAGTVSGTAHGKSVNTRTGTDFLRSIKSATVSVSADGPGGSVTCGKTTHM